MYLHVLKKLRNKLGLIGVRRPIGPTFIFIIPKFSIYVIFPPITLYGAYGRFILTGLQLHRKLFLILTGFRVCTVHSSDRGFDKEPLIIRHSFRQ